MSQTQLNSKKCFKEIYKFYYDYLKVYKLASSPRVSCWKQSDLRNAMAWSSACEELTSKLGEKEQFYEILLGEINAILIFLQVQCPLMSRVKQLIENAAIEMQRTIFENDSLSDDLKSDLVNLIHADLYESVCKNIKSLNQVFLRCISFF